MKPAKPKLTFKIEPDGSTATVVGRQAWALNELIKAGSRGITSVENPAPRLSHYIMCLRRIGLSIETEDEKHSGPFSGTHGRYRLRTRVSVVPPIDGGISDV